MQSATCFQSGGSLRTSYFPVLPALLRMTSGRDPVPWGVSPMDDVCRPFADVPRPAHRRGIAGVEQCQSDSPNSSAKPQPLSLPIAWSPHGEPWEHQWSIKPRLVYENPRRIGVGGSPSRREPKFWLKVGSETNIWVQVAHPTTTCWSRYGTGHLDITILCCCSGPHHHHVDFNSNLRPEGQY